MGSPPLNSRLSKNDNEFVGSRVFVEVGAQVWGGIGREPEINRSESFACVNEGRQIVAGGISKPADLFEGWLRERGGVSCRGPG